MTIDELLDMANTQQFKCAITGLPMTTIEHCYTSISIDRINSNRHYSIDNVQLVCKGINLGKKNFNDSRIRELIVGLKTNTIITPPTLYRHEKRYKKYQRSVESFLKHKLDVAKRNKLHLVLVDLPTLISKWTNYCHILNLPIYHVLHDPLSASLDRIDSNLPYTTENTIISCQFANLARNNGPLDEFNKFINSIRAI